jgi:hypothetical protein
LPFFYALELGAQSRQISDEIEKIRTGVLQTLDQIVATLPKIRFSSELYGPIRQQWRNFVATPPNVHPIFGAKNGVK